MAISLIEGLQYLLGHPGPSDEAKFLEACRTVVIKRAKLMHRVWLRLPQGANGQFDPKWNDVIAGSVAVSEDRTERLVEPKEVRLEFVPKLGESVVVRAGEMVFIKVMGSHNRAAVVRVMMLDMVGGLAVMVLDPLIADPLSPVDPIHAYGLDAFAEVLADSNLVVARTFSDRAQEYPIFRLVSIDAAAKTFTIQLDRAMEVFEPTETERAEGKVVRAVGFPHSHDLQGRSNPRWN